MQSEYFRLKRKIKKKSEAEPISNKFSSTLPTTFLKMIKFFTVANRGILSILLYVSQFATPSCWPLIVVGTYHTICCKNNVI